jgi:hypothetical protein
MSSPITTSSSPTSDVLSTKLNDFNYQSWVIKMKALLMAKKLWMHVIGIIKRPTPPSEGLDDWLINAYAASGLILLNMEDSQHTHVEGLEESPDKMWKTLEDIYVQKRPNSRFMALSNLLSISKQPDEPLPVVSTRVEQAVKDVKALCPKDYTMEQLYDDLCCMAMIRSLGPDYSSFVSSISLMDDINMLKLKSAFLTEESNRRAMEAHSGPTAAASLAASSSSTSSSSNSTPFICGWS